mmetsp:Transcript_64724/g.76641  ORF Transcript_64724/g.76641 Transcript_64724/m.76641 type:complete len:83 (+) Transcript_64724:67-315(+)
MTWKNLPLKEYGGARNCFEKGLLIQGGSGDDEESDYPSYYWHEKLGDVYTSQGDTDLAKERYSLAKESLRSQGNNNDDPATM